MKMLKCGLLIVGIISINMVNAGVLLDSNYVLETYATYSSNSYPAAMTFDNQGNLYVVHPNLGKIVKVDTDKTASTFCSGLSTPVDIVFTGESSYPSPLYVMEYTSANGRIAGLSLNGDYTVFATTNSPYHAPGSMALAPQGAFGGYLYFGATGQDRLGRINFSGSISSFSSWPGWTDGGGPYGMTFDPSGLFGGNMFIGSTFSSGDADISGVFSINASGNVTRVTNSLVKAEKLKFDTYGTWFNHDLFVWGTDSWTGTMSLWRVKPDGTSTEFYRGVPGLAFGSDGALYVHDINYDLGMVTISRIVPEPLTLSLLALGGLALRRR